MREIYQGIYSPDNTVVKQIKTEQRLKIINRFLKIAVDNILQCLCAIVLLIVLWAFTWIGYFVFLPPTL